MLSEARARLANTKGKKAKRKAREKQLEEARRLASLQKKRELKAAGIETVKRAKRVRGIDYNAEIAFERKPAPGFYDVTEERLAQPDPFDEKNFKPTTVEEMEGPRKKDLEEKLRAQDVKRQRINERRDAPSAVATTNALNDPSAVRRRSKLMLPEPQVSDRELEEMAKMSGAAMMDVDADDDTPGGALVSRYGVPPASSSGAAAARTPQIGGHDAILQEAQNLRRLAEGQTPLLGGENPTLAGSDFSGITPARRDAPTPNPLAGATPARGFAGATPSAARHRAGIDSVGATPLRDSLNINDPDAMLAPPEGRAGKARATLARNELRESLASLPAPMNEYQVMIPDLPEDDDEGAGLAMEEDMGDVLAREAAARAEEEAAELRRRSAAIRRGTPRPTPESRGPSPPPPGAATPPRRRRSSPPNSPSFWNTTRPSIPPKKRDVLARCRTFPAWRSGRRRRRRRWWRERRKPCDARWDTPTPTTRSTREPPSLSAGIGSCTRRRANPCRDARRNPRIAWRRRRRNTRDFARRWRRTPSAPPNSNTRWNCSPPGCANAQKRSARSSWTSGRRSPRRRRNARRTARCTSRNSAPRRDAWRSSWN